MNTDSQLCFLLKTKKTFQVFISRLGSRFSFDDFASDWNLISVVVFVFESKLDKQNNHVMPYILQTYKFSTKGSWHNERNRNCCHLHKERKERWNKLNTEPLWKRTIATNNIQSTLSMHFLLLEKFKRQRFNLEQVFCFLLYFGRCSTVVFYCYCVRVSLSISFRSIMVLNKCRYHLNESKTMGPPYNRHIHHFDFAKRFQDYKTDKSLKWKIDADNSLHVLHLQNERDWKV